MRHFFKDLLEGKFAIAYTLTTIAKLVPREIRWLNKVPVLGYSIRIGQFFWFLTKIIFFAMVISWFKPQYNHGGAKIALLIIAVGVVFFAAWIMNKELNRKNVLK